MHVSMWMTVVKTECEVESTAVVFLLCKTACVAYKLVSSTGLAEQQRQSACYQ